MTGAANSARAIACGVLARLPGDERIALVDGARAVSYGALHSLVEDAATTWRRHGVDDGDAVLVVAEARIDSVIALLGAALAGAVVVLQRPGQGAAWLDARARQYGARLVWNGSVFRRVEHVPTETEVPSLPPLAGLVLPTSGTTGRPRGVVHRLDRVLENALMHAAAIGLRRDDTVGIHAPLSHAAVLVAGLLAALARAARVAFVAEPFPVALPARLDALGVTVTAIVPSQVEEFVAGCERARPRLRVLTIGGDTLRAEHEARLAGLVRGGVEVFATYGLSEAGPRVCTRRLHADRPAPHSIGPPLDGVTLAVLGDDDTVRTEGRGELLVRTPTAMLARLGDGTAAWHGPPETGWLRSGDAVDLDADGARFLGRTRHLVKVAGESIYPADVEAVLRDHPRVRGARVFLETPPGSPSRLVAEVVTTDDADVDTQALRAHCRDRLPRPAVPHVIRRVAHLGSEKGAHSPSTTEDPDTPRDVRLRDIR